LHGRPPPFFRCRVTVVAAAAVAAVVDVVVIACPLVLVRPPPPVRGRVVVVVVVVFVVVVVVVGGDCDRAGGNRCRPSRDQRLATRANTTMGNVPVLLALSPSLARGRGGATSSSGTTALRSACLLGSMGGWRVMDVRR
jgi:hypothetical protein